MTRKRTELDNACIMAKQLGVSLWTSTKPAGTVWWLETRYVRTRHPTMHYSLESLLSEMRSRIRAKR